MIARRIARRLVAQASITEVQKVLELSSLEPYFARVWYGTLRLGFDADLEQGREIRKEILRYLDLAGYPNVIVSPARENLGDKRGGIWFELKVLREDYVNKAILVANRAIGTHQPVFKDKQANSTRLKLTYFVVDELNLALLNAWQQNTFDPATADSQEARVAKLAARLRKALDEAGMNNVLVRVVPRAEMRGNVLWLVMDVPNDPSAIPNR